MRGVRLEQVAVTEQGRLFRTNTPVEFRYVRSTARAPYFGAQYQQNLEPHGRYLLHNEEPGDLARDWETGLVRFAAPLVIPFNACERGAYDECSWKAKLVAAYHRRGLALSRALLREGFDAIVTVGTHHGQPMDTREIVDLSVMRGR
jgi:hypothetical protein